MQKALSSSVKYLMLQITILCLILSCQNNSSAIKYHSEFEDCELRYDALDRQINPAKGEPDDYFYKGKAFTGCARMDHPNNEQYFIYWIENGHITLEKGYYYNGELGRIFEFKDGIRHGTHKMFYDDGQLYVEEYYKKGKPDSLHFRWHASRKLAREAKYKKGKLKWEKIYDEKGQLIKEKK